jgi:hypothetical protein
MTFNTKKRGPVWEPWIERVVWEIARSKDKNFSWTANYLIETKLNELGYYREDFEPDAGKAMCPKPETIDGVIFFRPEMSGKDLWLGRCKILSFRYHNGYKTF